MPSLVNINSISPDLRDVLLGLNLQPSPTISSNNYEQYLKGVGLPFTVTYGSGVLAPLLSVQQLGDFYRANSYQYNEFQAEPNFYSDSGVVIGDSLGIFDSNKVKTGYLDANGKLNVGGPSTEPYNVISSLLKGGVGFNKSGGGGPSIVSNNDVRNTIVGRALTAGGLINDTDLGIIGAERLAISLANNAAFKLQKETIGKVNLDIFSWIDGKKDDFIKPNYEITVPAGLLGKTVDFLGDLAGFTRPRSQMKTEFFSFDEKFTPTGIGNIARANGMLETTGKGQVVALFRNVQASLLNSNFTKQGYAPGIVNKRVDGDDTIRHNVYAYGDDDGEILENSIYNEKGNGNGRWTDGDGSGFEGDYFTYKTDGNGGNFGSPTESDFVWSDEKINVDENGGNSLIGDADLIFGNSPTEGETNSLYNPNRKSILYKTKELFKQKKIATLVNGHLTFTNVSQVQSSVIPDNGIMSKGNAALTKDALNNKFEDRTKVFCRTWTPMDKYDEVQDLIRHRALDKDGGTYRRSSYLSESSILENTGFVKIARYVSDTGSIKRHMFSIENLAWKGFAWKDADKKHMPACEEGPYGGRIMWFPPYDIKFSESTSVNWDKHSFIGRGEPMYTYNNTERTGQLSFKVIIDHPNQLNRKVTEGNVALMKTETSDEDAHYASFFAGCNVPEILKNIDNTKKTEKKEEPIIPVITSSPPMPPAFRVFFPNDNHTYPFDYPEYESGIATPAGVANIREIKHYGTDVVIKNTAGKKITVGSKTPNISRYIGYEKDPNNNNKYRNYNTLMGNPVNGVKTLGPANAITTTPNDYTTYKIDYKTNPTGEYLGLGLIPIGNTKFAGCATEYYVDRYNYGLNANRYDIDQPDRKLTLPGNDKYKEKAWGGWLASNDIDGTTGVSYLTALKEHMHHENGPCKDCVIKIEGYASKQCDCASNPDLPGKDCQQRNQLLSDNRANSVKKYLEQNVLDTNDPNKAKRIEIVDGKGQTSDFNKFVDEEDACKGNSPTDIVGCKMNRRVNVSFRHEPSLRQPKAAVTPIEIPVDPNAKVRDLEAASVSAKKLGGTPYYQECEYFSKILENDPFTFKKISDKIKFFSPAFHSTTPEGFNSRLTFLQQCTRQGPSVYTDVNKPDNLVFGRPPVCVLRIGDFYYTKIIIESLSIDYEPLVWDLNPEGVGVQPMIANVSMNFAFIGGSSLDGPISKLQNALSFNYYANTGLFVGKMADNNGLLDTEKDTSTELEKTSNVYENETQTTTIPSSSIAETAQSLDKELLEAGVLSLKYDDFGIFQGKVKGKFTVKSKLSKEYNIKLRTEPYKNSVNDEVNLGAEPIDVQKIKFNDLKVNFESKSKTTKSLQRWDNYFTDTEATANLYESAQRDLDKYINENTGADKAFKDKGCITCAKKDDWDLQYIYPVNYTFVIEVEELQIRKEYKARWSPKFKSKRHNNPVNDPNNTYEFLDVYTYEAYVSGGDLAIISTNVVNDASGAKTTVFETPDETSKREKQENKDKKDKEKELKKTKKATEKEDKKNKKQAIKDQKALVKAGGGSLL